MGGISPCLRTWALVHARPEVIRRIETYLAEAGKGGDRQGAMFRLINNWRSGELNKLLNATIKTHDRRDDRLTLDLQV